MSSKHCPECNSAELTIEDYVLVCTNCGNVINDVPETVNTSGGEKKVVDCTNSSKGQVIHQHVNDYCWNHSGTLSTNNNAKTLSRKLGTTLIVNICINLSIPKRIRQLAIEFFIKCLSNKEIKFKSFNLKQTLALCCLYLITNQENYPMSLLELIKNTDYSFNRIQPLLLQLQKMYPEMFQQNNLSKCIETLVPLYLNKYDFDKKEKMKISEYACDLCWMWRESLLVQGQNPINIIHCALFLAWKAVNPSRTKMTLKQFCKKFNIEEKRIIKEKVNFFTKILIDYTKCCPMLDDIEPSKISLRIPEIISMKRMILFNYKPTKNNEETCPAGEKSIKESTGISEMNPNDGNDDLDDSEIDSYIRTEDEIQNIKQMKQIN